MAARRRRFVALGAALAIAHALACSLVLDPGGLSAGAGGTEAGSGGGGDDTANDDGGALDGASDDGQRPGEAGVDVANPPGCDATFCDNFDDQVLGARWSTVTATNGAALTLEDAGLSAPFALRMDLPDRDSGVTRKAQLAKSFGIARRIACDVQLFVVKPAVVGVEGYGLFILRPTPSLSSNGYAIEVKVEDDETIQVTESYKVGDAGTTHKISLGAAATGRWLHLGLTTDFTSLDATLDATQATLVLTPAAGGVVDGGATVLTVGLGEDSDIDKPGFIVRFDDFACTLTP